MVYICPQICPLISQDIDTLKWGNNIKIYQFQFTKTFHKRQCHNEILPITEKSIFMSAYFIPLSLAMPSNYIEKSICLCEQERSKKLLFPGWKAAISIWYLVSCQPLGFCPWAQAKVKERLRSVQCLLQFILSPAIEIMRKRGKTQVVSCFGWAAINPVFLDSLQ